MNLWLSPLGVWYYRKVTILPCDRRKDMKRSLCTRDKRLAHEKVALLLPVSAPVQLPQHILRSRPNRSRSRPTRSR